MSNIKLAKFITSLGRFNNYGSTVAQTQKALDTGSLTPLRDDNDDRVIFEDSLKAIQLVKQMTFGIESIISINAQFTGDSHEQPNDPGRLRDIVVDPIRDRIHVDLWLDENGDVVSYYPPTQVDKEDVNDIVSEWLNSEHTTKDAWKIFARLAKLQPFQDGNKRTALIAANHAIGALLSEDYLMPPAGRQYNRFMDNLLAYYGVGLEGAPTSEGEALDDFVKAAMPVRKAPTPRTPTFKL